MKNKRLCFPDNFPDLLFRKRLDILFFQVRIHIVQITADKDLLQQFYGCRGQQVRIKIARCQNHNDLQRHRNHFGHGDDIRLNVILLFGIHQTVLICHKIGAHRIKQENQIIQRQVTKCDTFRLFHKIRQERDNHKSDSCYHEPDNPVCLLIQKHIRLDLLVILMNHRFIQAVVQCRANSQLCHGQYRQNAGI